MKKIVKSSLFVLAAVAVSVACSKEMSPVIPGNQVTITAYIPDELTKVSFTPDANLDGPVKIAWEDLDKIRVIDHNDATDNSQFTIQPGFTAHQASFSGTAVEATSYDILYPGTMESVAEAEAVQFGIQTQTNNADAAQLAYMALLSNVNTYESVEFSEAWATAHGGSFKQTGILRLRIQLPDGFTGDVASVTVNAPSALFYKSNALISKEKVSSLKLNFTGAGATPDAGVITGYVMLPWENVTIAANTTLSVIVETADHKFYTKSFTPSTTEDVVLTMGRVNAIKINKTGFGAASTDFAGGSGTADDPYLISTPSHVLNIGSKLVAGVQYFKMIDDVDMSGETWERLNTGTPYQPISFDGNFKIISHLGGTMFYVFKGSMKNLTLDGSSVTNGAKKGVLAQFIQGTGNTLTNVDVCNVASFPAANGPCGGMVGLINSGDGVNVSATFVDCDVKDVIVSSSGSDSMAGGIIGLTAEKVVLSNCTRTGSSVNNNYDSVGGFIGKTTAEVTISNCSISGSRISGRDAIGGLVGQCEAASSITSCSVKAEITGRNYIGGIIGRETAESGTLSISKCSVNGINTGITGSNQYVGGILGNKYGIGTVNIENCYVNSPVTATDAWAGGISSNHYKGTMTISRCYVMGAISAKYGAGGVVGQVKVANLTINPVAVYVSSITATATDADAHESSGTIVAYGKNVNVTIARNCWYDQTLTFSECPGNSGSPSKWCPDRQTGLSNAKISGGSPHASIYPYWGRYTNPSDYPLNKMCKDILEFSDDVWNLDVNPPILK